MHDFRKKINAAVKAEIAFLRSFSGLKKLDGFGADFRTSTGQGLEIKVESRSITQTPNIFIEVWSRPGVQGGPMQASCHSELYGHWFEKDHKLFLYETKALIRWIEKHINFYALVEIKNRGYSSYGIVVSRAAIRSLEVQTHDYGFKQRPQNASRPNIPSAATPAARVYRRIG